MLSPLCQGSVIAWLEQFFEIFSSATKLTVTYGVALVCSLQEMFKKKMQWKVWIAKT